MLNEIRVLFVRHDFRPLFFCFFFFLNQCLNTSYCLRYYSADLDPTFFPLCPNVAFISLLKILKDNSNQKQILYGRIYMGNRYELKGSESFVRAKL